MTVTQLSPTSSTPKAIAHFTREGTTGTCGSRATLKLSRFENVLDHSRSQLDLVLAHDNYNDVDVMTLKSNGGVNVPGSLTVGGTAVALTSDITNFATQGDVSTAVSGLATESYLDTAVSGLATESYVDTAVDNMVAVDANGDLTHNSGSFRVGNANGTGQPQFFVLNEVNTAATDVNDRALVQLKAGNSEHNGFLIDMDDDDA